MRKTLIVLTLIALLCQIGCAGPRYRYGISITQEVSGKVITETYDVSYPTRPTDWPAFARPGP